jgi:hypothetical protein
MKSPDLPSLLLACALAASPACSGLGAKSAHFRVPLLSEEEAEQQGLPRLRFIDRTGDPDEDLVQLVYERSLIVPALAIHPRLRTYDVQADRWDEWDVYTFWGLSSGEMVHTTRAPTPDGSGEQETEWKTLKWGAINKLENLPFIMNEGAVLGEWRGTKARRILEVLEHPEHYPHIKTYRYWPGPNSNTYVTWVLRQAGVRIDHHPLAVGKDYLGLWGFGAWTTTTRTGLQLESPILGAKLGLLDGIELHLLAMTLGIDLWPPAFKTPLGRFGVPE